MSDKWRAAHLAQGTPLNPSPEMRNGWDWCNERPSEHDARDDAIRECERRIDKMQEGGESYGGTGDLRSAYYGSLQEAMRTSGSGEIMAYKGAHFVVIAPGEDLIPKKKRWSW